MEIEKSPTGMKLPKRSGRAGYVYVVRCNCCESFYKIGRSKSVPRKRIKSYITNNPHGVEYIFGFRVKNSYERAEWATHVLLSRYHHHNEWFYDEGNNLEDICFSLTSSETSHGSDFKRLIKI
jgi:hypothetical protein